MRDYRAHMQTVLKRKPTTINAHLAAIADFYTRSTGLGAPVATRLDLPRTVSRALVLGVALFDDGGVGLWHVQPFLVSNYLRGCGHSIYLIA